MSKPYSITSRGSSIPPLLATFLGVVGWIVASDIPEGGMDTAPLLMAMAFVVGSFVVAVLLWIRVYRQKTRLKRRWLRMTELHAGTGLKSHMTLFVDSSLMELDDGKLVRNRKFENYVETGSLVYADFSYDINGRTKYGEYRAVTHYYSVMAAKLPRKMPHVIFDSLKSRKRQFRFMFAGNQLHNLEGDFNNHFAVYFPWSYHIDSLSFLAPDVLWALREASDYDFEIINDKIYMFGAMQDPDTQIEEMAKKLGAVVAALGKSPETYKDERLPYAESRQSVAPIGALLAKNLTTEYTKIFIAGLGLLALAVVVVITRYVGTPVFYAALLLVAMAVASIRRILRETKRRERALEQTNYLTHGQVSNNN